MPASPASHLYCDENTRQHEHASLGGGPGVEGGVYYSGSLHTIGLVVEYVVVAFLQVMTIIPV